MAEYNPTFEEAIDEFLSKLEQVLLEAVTFDQLASLQVIVDVLRSDLLDGESTEVGLGLAEECVARL